MSEKLSGIKLLKSSPSHMVDMHINRPREKDSIDCCTEESLRNSTNTKLISPSYISYEQTKEEEKVAQSTAAQYAHMASPVYMSNNNRDIFDTALMRKQSICRSRTDKAKKETPAELIELCWQKKAEERKGSQAVLSSRFSLQENEQANISYIIEVMNFLNGLIEGKRIFEFGVGIGRMTRPLSDKAREIVGIDFCPSMLEKARINLRNISNISLYQGRIKNFRHIFMPKSFDLIFDSIVLIHILNDEELVETIEQMKIFSNLIFIAEQFLDVKPDAHAEVGPYTLLRTRPEMSALFAPYKLVKEKTIFHNTDPITLQLYQKD